VSTAARLHVSARLEDRAHAALRAFARRRGWGPRITASIGYGTGSGPVHVFARVLLGPPADPARGGRRAVAPRGWRSLLALPATGEVGVTLAGHRHVVPLARGGYAHGELVADLAPGWHEAVLDVAGGAPVRCRIRVADPGARFGVVSDIDDTVLVTWVPRPLLAAWNTFLLREHARRPVPGMAELLRSLAGADGAVVYVSTGAWNFAPHLERFMAEHGFPPGPMLLTDWGPTERGWFRSGAEHKRASLERLRREHPDTRWVLVGDDGQRDPAIYREFAAAHPEAVVAIAIRALTPAQHVLAGPAAAPPADAVAPRTTYVTGADGHELRAGLAAAGVVEAATGAVSDG